MPQYQKSTDVYPIAKNIEYLKNYVANHKTRIMDSDIFDVFNVYSESEQIRRAICEECSEEEVKQMITLRDVRNRLDWDDEPKELLREFWNCAPKRCRAQKVLLSLLDALLLQVQEDAPQCSTFEKRWNALGDFLTLSALEREIYMVHFLVAKGMLNFDGNENDSIYDFIAKCLNCDVGSVLQCHGENQKLIKFLCLNSSRQYSHIFDSYLNGMRKSILGGQFYMACDIELLPWDYFSTITDKHGEILKRLISSNIGRKPVNILFYGAPGTGKSSFASALAEQLGLCAWNVAQASLSSGMDRCGNNTAANMRNQPDFRFAALLLTDQQLGTVQNHMLIVDEADQMLNYDKGLLNETMLQLRTPTIWITNTPPQVMEESTRRRFDYSICFEPLNKAQRLLIWQNNVRKFELSGLLDQPMLDELASRYEVSAGGITQTLANFVNMTPQKEEALTLIEKLIAPHCELIGKSLEPDKNTIVAQDYSIDGLNIDGDIALPQILDAARNFYTLGDAVLDRPRMNLLFCGAPGTGKTEFVKYLAQELNRKLLIRMGGDLLNMFVGGTEHNIQSAFAEAEAAHAILFLDEIDGMLQNRANAHHSWEVTQVNELLHCMENFNGIMIGATNFKEHLDPAVMRRFTFKLTFNDLDESGKIKFFERMFQTSLSAAEMAELAEIPHLAPGDFRTVRQSLFYLGSAVDNRRRLQALRQESATKCMGRNVPMKKIGFF